MSQPAEITADPVAEAERQRRRRHRRAFRLALLILAAIPTTLQIEPRRGARLDTVRVIGPADEASGVAAGGRRAAPGRAMSLAKALPPYYGGVREAPPSELELRSALGPNRVISASDAPALVEDPGAAFEPSDATSPIQPAAFSTPGGGPPSTFPQPPSTPTPPLIAGPVTTPGTPANPPVTGPVTPTPPVVVSPPTTTNPPTPPTDGGNPVVSPPTGTPDGPPVVVVTTPVDPGVPGNPDTPQTPDDPGGFQPGGGAPVNVTAVPEPSIWVELIAGFGLAGGPLRRRRRQPPTTFLARSSALAVASRLG
ncbi:MAG: hypothetical protein JSR98_04145 [Proteobacteria bacterium]|nr:hypothetical protein [Pseudomonadota bacterium]